jgi:antagonist of KipI
MAALTVIRPGMLTTIQDLGRWGRQHLGVPVAGPMDWFSHRLANLLLGNHEDDAALEITLMGPELEADDEIACVVTGAEFEVTAGSRRTRLGEPFRVAAGERLKFGTRISGARAVLAVQGGVQVPRVLGSRSTSLISRVGPFGGRALRPGDVLPVSRSRPLAARAPVRPLSLPLSGARVRVMLGPHDRRFSGRALEVFSASRFVVTPESNRMGYRLDGPRLEHSGTADMLSDATPIGSVQVPASGHPILLMADRQTTGGYPKIATVISADLPLAGQLAPGDWIEFEPCSLTAAIDALRQRTAALQGRTP